MKRIAKKRLAELDCVLSARDKAILRSLDGCRYLATGQIRRLHYADSKNPIAGHRSANFGTAKLRSYGLVDVLDRRVGGVRAGSSSYVWSITEAGVHLLNFNTDEYAPRKRNFEPSPNFMKHTLETSEVYVQLVEICRRHGLELVKAEMEPACWRGHTGADGKPATMKPDMFAVTSNGLFDDSWFIEVDMNTESPSVVLEKCRRYVHYCKTGMEQERNVVFPLVMWIAYSENRRAKLQQYISDCREMSETSKSIFTVIMPGDFESLIVNGADASLKRKRENETAA